jgi:hypothetical protein
MKISGRKRKGKGWEKHERQSDISLLAEKCRWRPLLKRTLLWRNVGTAGGGEGAWGGGINHYGQVISPVFR